MIERIDPKDQINDIYDDPSEDIADKTMGTVIDEVNNEGEASEPSVDIAGATYSFEDLE